MKFFRGRNEAFSPTIIGNDGVALLEFIGSRLNYLANRASFKGLAYFKRRHI
jgi:hypothetical protein